MPHVDPVPELEGWVGLERFDDVSSGNHDQRARIAVPEIQANLEDASASIDPWKFGQAAGVHDGGRTLDDARKSFVVDVGHDTQTLQS